MQALDWEDVVFARADSAPRLEPETARALESTGVRELYPMQVAALQHILHSGRDVAVRAPTGSGKTIAYALPLALALTPTVPHTQAVVLVPTQPLAAQVEEVLRTVAGPRGLSVASLGAKGFRDEQRCAAHIVVTKPGRLLHHLTQGTVDTRWVTPCVLDETDRLLRIPSLTPTLHLLRQNYRSGAFRMPISHLEKIAIDESAPPHRVRLLLFSATLSSSAAAFRRLEMFHPLLLDYASSFAQKDAEAKFVVPAGVANRVAVAPEKERALVAALRTSGKTLVFCQTTATATALGHLLRAAAELLHEPPSFVAVSSGFLDQREKLRVARKLERGAARVLVATEETARGMDFKAVETVLNFDLPADVRDYVHRAGRTGCPRRSHPQAVPGRQGRASPS